MPREEVSFPSRGARCAAWWYRPEAADLPPPAVVMAHGFAGVRAFRLDAFAERFAAAGFAVLVFDYRHFGASEGEPRQLVSVRRQLADWRAALDYLRGRGDVDPGRIALWGTSFSGGHVMKLAAADREVAACVAQVPFTDGVALLRTHGLGGSLRLLVAGVRDLLRGLLRRAPLAIGVVGAPGALAVMTTPDAEPGYLRMLPAGAEWRNEVPARVALSVLYRPARRSHAIACPLLVQVAEADAVTPAAPAERAARRAARAEVRRYPGGHFDFYVGERFEDVVADQLDFLARHLAARPGDQFQSKSQRSRA